MPPYSVGLGRLGLRGRCGVVRCGAAIRTFLRETEAQSVLCLQDEGVAQAAVLGLAGRVALLCICSKQLLDER